MMQYIITMPMLLFATVVLGTILANIKIKGVALGSAMIMFAGVIVSCLVGVYALSLPETHSMYKQTFTLLNNSIVPTNIQNLFNMMFLACVGLIASKNLIPILKKYGVRFLALAIIITTLGFVGTYATGALTKQYTAFEMSGVFSGALTSTPGITASLASSEDIAAAQIDEYASLSREEQTYIVDVVGEPAEEESFSPEQKEAYQKHAETITGIGYTVTYPFGSLLVILLVNIIPGLFRLNVDDERRRYEIEMESIVGKEDSTAQRTPKGVVFSTISVFFVFLLGEFIGSLKFGSFSLTSTAGVLIVALALGAKRSFLGMNFVMDESVLKSLKDFSVSGLLACIGLRLGYSAMTTITSAHIWLILYATIIGVAAMLLGFVIGHYLMKLNWMILCGALCGGMTNTSGLSIAIDACKSDYPSVGYAATYPFAVIMMVVFNLVLQNMHFL